MDKFGVVSAFENGLSGCQLPFRTVAERFHLIDNAAKAVYIPEGEGANLVERLRGGEHSRGLFRKLGQYGVSVYDGQFQELLDSGCLELLEDGSAILTDLSQYIQNIGLVRGSFTTSPVLASGSFPRIFKCVQCVLLALMS